LKYAAEELAIEDEVKETIFVAGTI